MTKIVKQYSFIPVSVGKEERTGIISVNHCDLDDNNKNVYEKVEIIEFTEKLDTIKGVWDVASYKFLGTDQDYAIKSILEYLDICIHRTLEAENKIVIYKGLITEMKLGLGEISADIQE